MADTTDWEFVKLELERLYLQENRTLNDVMKYMAEKYAFRKTQAQYHRQFGKWGLRKTKKRRQRVDWKYISRKTQKRRREYNKKSELYVDEDQYYPPDKLGKALYREEAFVSTAELVTVASPKTPDGINVCTPPELLFAWDASLPWLRFSRLLRSARDHDPPSLSFALTVASPREAATVSRIVKEEVMLHLSSIVPWKKFTCSPTINRIATGLSILMPQEDEDQHRVLATRLYNSRKIDIDILSLELFLLANNLSNRQTPKSRRSHDRKLVDMFRVLGWNSVAHLKVLLSTQEPIDVAIAEKLFASALRVFALDIVEMMLVAGMSPNGRINSDEFGPLTPLQFAASAAEILEEVASGERMELIKLLLSHGADVNLSYDQTPPLQFAVWNHDEEAILVLLSHGAIVEPSCLADAGKFVRDVTLFSELLGLCPDMNGRNKFRDFTALGEAVLSENIPIISLLLAKGADVNVPIDIRFNGDWRITTVLGLAVRSGKVEISESVLQACMDVNFKVGGQHYVSPLALAVEAGDAKITELLLQKGGDVRLADEGLGVTLIELAVKTRNVALCEILIEYHAMVDRRLSEEQQTTSALCIAVEQHAVEIMDLLIRAGARLNDEYSRGPGSVLAMALEIGCARLIDMLQDAGATMIGRKLRQIGSWETVNYLQRTESLQGILDTCGANILTAALLARDDDLVEFLLDHNVDVNNYNMNDTADIRGVPDIDGTTDMDNATDIEDTMDMDNIKRKYTPASPKTPLAAAIRTGNLAFAGVILDRRARVTDHDLAEAVNYSLESNSNAALLRHLLSHFVGNAPTAVAIATLEERLDLLHLILAEHADPRGTPQLFQDGWVLDTPHYRLEGPESVLEIAVLRGNRQILEILLQRCTWEPRLSGRALTVAILSQREALVEDLLKLTEDVNQEIAIHFKHEECCNPEEYFLVGKVTTPLQAAVRYQQVSVARKLIEHPNININYLGEGDFRRTALQYAVEEGNVELVDMLVNGGADINGAPAMHGGATALQIAAIKGYLGIARKLINLKADINAAPARWRGRTALEGAAEHGHIDMLQMLYDQGASIVGDGERQYQRAVQLAECEGHVAAAMVLRSFKSPTQFKRWV